MPSIFTTTDVMVQTVQVEIQVLKVGKKQVTMGMFRQLPLRPLFPWWTLIEDAANGWWDEEDPAPLHLRGTPWGHVHYWWDANDREKPEYLTPSGRLQFDCGERLHLLWCDQGRLSRDIVYEATPQAILDASDPYGRDERPVLQPYREEIVRWWQAEWQGFRQLPQLFIAV